MRQAEIQRALRSLRSQQHRQHFNLTESSKQMLEELTAQRYPGKQRRQSQLIEDLITEAFTRKEHRMSAVTTDMYDPDRLAPATREAISIARREAARMPIKEVYPEQLLLGLVMQGDEKVMKALHRLGIDPHALLEKAPVFYYTASNELPTDESWATAEQRYTIGQIVAGTITRVTSFGLFVRIEDGIEGLVHLSELPPGVNPQAELREGQQVHVRVLRIDAERRRLGLSMRQIDQAHDEEEVSTAEAGSESVARVATKAQGDLPLSMQALKCIDWALHFATEAMHSPVVMPEYLLLSVLRHRRMRCMFVRLLPAMEPLLAKLLERVGSEYTTYMDQLIRAQVVELPGYVVRDAPEISFTPSMNVCPACQRAVQPQWKHCVYCGVSLARFCSSCGAPRAEGEEVKFCFACGRPLEQTPGAF